MAVPLYGREAMARQARLALAKFQGSLSYPWVPQFSLETRTKSWQAVLTLPSGPLTPRRILAVSYRECQKFLPIWPLLQEPKSPLTPLCQRGEVSEIPLKIPL